MARSSAKKKLNPLVLLGAAAAGIALITSSKKSSAAPPGGGAAVPPATIPAEPEPGETDNATTVSANGHTWKVALVDNSEPKIYDVFAPAGSWGPHGELRVVRYSQAAGSPPTRRMVAAAEGVPSQILAAAVTDFGLTIPAPTVSTPPGRPPMPPALQQEMIAVMKALGVDANGVLAGPVSATGVRQATELASRLEQAGYPEAAALMRQYAVQAAQNIPTPPPAQQPPMPPSIPEALRTAIARAIELERDPAKLIALKNSLLSLPPSTERDMLISVLDAIIRDVQTQQAIAAAAVDVDQIVTSPGQPTGSPGSIFTPSPQPAVLPLPIAPATIGTRNLTIGMKGEDVRAWQNVLRADGSTIAADGVFGSATQLATKMWQAKRGITSDGIVGPVTLSKIGTPPTVTTPSASTAAASSIGTRLLKLVSPNMTGTDVTAWQRVLIDSGYAITADGAFGPKTDAATRDWQAKHGIVADGIVGPATRAKIGTAPNAPLSVPATPVPQPLPTTKSPREVAADAMAAHLISMQNSYGVAGSKTKFDKNIVVRFQQAAGLTADGLPGPGTLTAAAQSGVGILPKVLYWPSAATRSNLTAYRNGLESIAAKAASLGFTTLAAQIRASAAAELGQGSTKGSL